MLHLFLHIDLRISNRKSRLEILPTPCQGGTLQVVQGLCVAPCSHRYLFAGLGPIETASCSKRGSPRSGSNIGSSRSNAGVSGTFSGGGPAYGIESSFCKAAMARSGSPICAA